MLLNGVNHAAAHNNDTNRLHAFYREVFDATETQRQTPMFGRGRIDHLGLQEISLDAFEEIRRRVIAREASDGFVTDFGPILSVFFRDPDGLECEVCVANLDAQPEVFNPRREQEPPDSRVEDDSWPDHLVKMTQRAGKVTRLHGG
jgi:hypothetical protein